MNKAKETGNELFDRFWKAYPRKEGKPKAQRTFEKMKVTSETLEKILSELERQSKMKDWEHISTKYIPLAQTWLNRKDWEENQNGTSENGNTGDTGHQYGYWVC